MAQRIVTEMEMNITNGRHGENQVENFALDEFILLVFFFLLILLRLLLSKVCMKFCNILIADKLT